MPDNYGTDSLYGKFSVYHNAMQTANCKLPTGWESNGRGELPCSFWYLLHNVLTESARARSEIARCSA